MSKEASSNAWIWILVAVVAGGFLVCVAGAGVLGVVAWTYVDEPAAPSEELYGPVGFAPPDVPLPDVTRNVPFHDESFLHGCATEDVLDAVDAIDGAISIGAPAYNAGDFQGCYTTYARTAADLESRNAVRCPGIARAMAEGRVRATLVRTDAEKAWALRDAFDGLVEVIVRAEVGL
jgi:hypothetical protein